VDVPGASARIPRAKPPAVRKGRCFVPTPFSRTLRSLEADRSRRRGVALVFFVLGGAWAAWLVLGRVPLYEVTETARLEVARAAHAVTAVVGGRVVETKLRIGQEVRAGEVLVVLDAETERRALREKQTRRQTLHARLTALRGEIRAEEEALGVQRKARLVALDEARVVAKEAAVRAESAEHQARTSERLAQRFAISTEELHRDQAEAEAQRTFARARGLAADRLEQDRTLQETERQARLAKLAREVVELEGEAAVEDAAIRRLDHDIELRSLRAPVSGRVGEAGDVRLGTVVRPAERLGSIVPPGPPRAVAWFPTSAVGRLRPTQPARLRLHGFPWTQYGTLTAMVADVGNEPSDGRVRVELTLDARQEAAIPLEHGLPGAAEVEVERVAPLVLGLRAAGQLLAPRN
jgi:membrane fusion protein (multidrug efflux system)